MFKHVASVSCLVLIVPGVSLAGVVRIPQTGQHTCYNAAGVIIDCTGTGQDGEKRAGAVLPAQRFTDNENGTVSDNLTGLIWLQDAGCTDTAGGISRADGMLDWQAALSWSNSLSSGTCGLNDNSAPGDWRLPNINELRSLIDYSSHDPALTGEHPFTNVQPVWYWSSTTNPVYTSGAYNVGLSRGSIHVNKKLYSAPGTSRVGTKASSFLGVWPVRGGLHADAAID
jgi:hypothetical protein